MITILNKNKASEQGTSSYNLSMLDVYLSRKNFINSVSSVTSPVPNFTNFNSFMNLIYNNNIYNNLSFWFSSQYTERSGTIVGNLQDIDKIFFYSKDKNYSGQFLSCPTLMTKAKFDSTDNSIRFSNTESLYYHLNIDKTFPLGNSNKTIVLVMSPLNSTYEVETANENNWFFSYGLDWVSSLQPSSEGLCFTYDSLLTGGKKLSYTIGGNNNTLITYENLNLARKGALILTYNNSDKILTSNFQGLNGETINFSEVVSGSPKTNFTLPITPANINSIIVYVNSTLKTTSDYSLSGSTLIMNQAVDVGENLIVFILVSDGLLDTHYPIDIKSGNGFFINSHVVNNSIHETSLGYNRMKNWKLYEFMIFDTNLSLNLVALIYAYLQNKYSLVSL